MGRYQTRRNLTKGDDQVTDVPRQADLRQRALACMPGGVNSNVRLESARRFFERGTGAWLWDTDGHDYVDYALGMGAMFLGHAHPDSGHSGRAGYPTRDGLRGTAPARGRGS